MTKEHAYAYESGYRDGMDAARNELATQLVWHDYAIRALCDALELMDGNVAYGSETIKALGERKIAMARNALSNAQVVREVGDE